MRNKSWQKWREKKAKVRGRSLESQAHLRAEEDGQCSRGVAKEMAEPGGSGIKVKTRVRSDTSSGLRSWCAEAVIQA